MKTIKLAEFKECESCSAKPGMPTLCTDCLMARSHAYGFNEGITQGRLSVLQDFDAICLADAFVGFTEVEWTAIKKFFAFNKTISGWDK